MNDNSFNLHYEAWFTQPGTNESNLTSHKPKPLRRPSQYFLLEPIIYEALKPYFGDPSLTAISFQPRSFYSKFNLTNPKIIFSVNLNRIAYEQKISKIAIKGFKKFRISRLDWTNICKNIPVDFAI